MSESKANAAIQEEERIEMEKVSKDIQVVLESNKFALQPFLQYTEYGIVPRVKLIKVPVEADKSNPTTNDEQTGDKGESEESKESDGAAESK